jgi:hypothetical protein
MKHKTWFRLVLKAIGVLLIGWSIPAMVQTLIQLIQYGDMFTFYAPYSMNSPPTRSTAEIVWGIVLGSSPHLMMVAFGLYLFFGGKWIVNKAIPSNRAYCPECGYQIANAESASCPECGVVLPRSGANESSGI